MRNFKNIQIPTLENTYRAELWELRKKFTKEVSWAIPNEEAIEAIVSFANGKKIVDIGAGYAFWDALIADKGGDVVALDVPEHGGYLCDGFEPFYPVQKMEQENILGYILHNKEVLMFIWPPYDEECSRYYLENTLPNKIVYVGEGDGGCCATSSFFEFLNEEYEEVNYINIPQWYGIFDRVYLYKRR